MTYDDQNDIDLLALCTWKEARGEGELGCDAVMHVIKNRIGATGFAHTLHDVVMGRNQFSSMSIPSDLEFNLQPKSDDAIYLHCVDMASKVLTGSETDPTHGAHYYVNLTTMQMDGWFERNIVLNRPSHPICAVIGRHTFFL